MLLSLVAFMSMTPKTLVLVPKETIWVYENASSPADGTFLRAWGVEGKSCPAEGEDAGAFSYSYLKWDFTDLPKTKLLSAKLEFSNIPDPGFTLDIAKKSPLEAREIVGDFSAKTWAFEMAAKVRPASGKNSVYGTGYPKSITPGAPVAISIDLLAGPNLFAKALAQAAGSPSHQFSLSITSALDPSVEGRSCVYKVYGQKESKEYLRPRLVLTFEE